MSRIQRTFERLASENRKALIPFITAGYPEPELTVPLMRALVTNGADIIELGVPFSDPMADGPTIQRASERALEQGMSLRGVLAVVREFRAEDDLTPVVLMGYANPVEALGADVFITEARHAGVDGVLVVDYPPEESVDFSARLRESAIDPIFLLAPTSTDERFSQVARMGSGYIYYVSLKGVTGSGHLDLDEVARRIPLLRHKVGMPVAVGFGIRDAQSAQRIGTAADAVIIGSRIIEEMEGSPREDVVVRAAGFLHEIRVALDSLSVAREIS